MAVKSALMKALPWVALTIALLLFVAAILFVFGGPQPPSAAARAEYDRAVADGLQPKFEARFVIPIPGCVCHSDNPVSVVRHSIRRLGECSGCHGSVPQQ